ncbi:MAG: restriction endonuclease subunit S [Rhodocyclaceae bacterium]|nr:restriction endonuclease subunit S [Rhodocyclaceae bacterium]
MGTVTDYGKTVKVEPADIPADAWVLELEDIEKDSSRILQRLTQSVRQSLSTKNRFDAGDVLYGKLRPYLNKVVIADAPGFCTTEIVPMQAGPGLERRYLFHWLKHPAFLKYVEAASHGMNMPRLGTDAGKAAPLVLAPRPEQTRIADQLDTLLARIQACQDRLEAIPALLKRFRQAVVSAGMSGDLTADWREASADIESSQSELQALCDADRVITYGVVKLGDEVANGTPCLRTSNVRWLRFENDGMKRIAPSLSAQYARTVLRGGEVLVNVRGTLGGVALATPEMKGWNVSREIAVVAIDEGRASAEYVALWIASDVSQRWLGAMKKGVAYVGINIEDLRKLPVRLPARDEQDEIVRRVHSCLKLADRIDARCAAAQQQARRVPSLTLDKAFRGELVPQDPNDEPASALLARIATQRNVPTDTTSAPTPSRGRPPRTSKETGTMTKSRQDHDVMNQPYLAGHLRRIGTPASAEALFKVAELPVADFYKQLAWEVAQGYVKDNKTTLEPGHAAG